MFFLASFYIFRSYLHQLASQWASHTSGAFLLWIKYSSKEQSVILVQPNNGMKWKKFSFTFSESRYSAFVMAILLECDGAEDWPYFGKAGPDMGKGYYPHILKAIFSNIVYSLQNKSKISSKKDFYFLQYHVKWFPHLVIGSDSNRKLVSTFQTKRLLPRSYYC